MIPTHFEIGAWAMVLFLHDTSGVEYAELIYGKDKHPNYLAEKAELFAKSPTSAISALDAEHILKLLAIVMARHGNQAQRMLTTFASFSEPA